jgi:hypothetical protein
LANTRARREQCDKLVNAMYEWRGYGAQRETHEPSMYEVTLLASRDEEVIGTLTISRDSPTGIPADGLYKDEIDAYRRAGASVCEITRLAMDPARRSKEALDELFYHAYIHAGICGGATDVFIEVNPRHVAFYKRLLKFSQIGEEKTCERVNAPAILLHQKIAAVGQQIAKCREARIHAKTPQPLLLSRNVVRNTGYASVALAA